MTPPSASRTPPHALRGEDAPLEWRAPGNESKHRRQRLARGLAFDHRHDLELDDLLPVGDPALEQGDVVGLHELEAAAEIGADVPRHQLQPVAPAAAR